MGLKTPASIVSAVAVNDDARALVMAAKAARLRWNRGSLRIIRDAQERVALERPDILQYNV
ncbi:MAG: hypothetical protein WCA12_12805 [Burkholderiales bacterium]